MPPRRRPDKGQVEATLVALVKDWFEAHRGGRAIAIGIANGGLHLLEHFKSAFPLSEADYASPGGSQVRGLSGSSGDKIIARFLPGMSSIGTEAGRTSRGTLPAVRDLAHRLNDRADIIQPLTARARANMAEAMQRWIIGNPIQAYFGRKKLSPALDPRHSSPATIAAILAAAKARDQMGQVAQHLIGAKLALRYPNRDIENYSSTAADTVTRRRGDFVVGRTVFHVTIAPSPALLEKCRQNIKQGYRPLVLVPDEKRAGASQMADSLGLANVTAVMAIETFVGQNIEEIAEFDQSEFENQLRRLLEVYNEPLYIPSRQAYPRLAGAVPMPTRLVTFAILSLIAAACASSGGPAPSATPSHLTADEAVEIAISSAGNSIQDAGETSAELTTYGDVIDDLGGGPEPGFTPADDEPTWLVRAKGMFVQPSGPPPGPSSQPSCKEIVALVLDAGRETVHLSIGDSDGCS